MDRKTTLAIILMMIVALTPAVLFKRPARLNPPQVAGTDSLSGPAALPATPPGVVSQPSTEPDTAAQIQSLPEDTVAISSDLYTYRVSTKGGRLISAVLHQYRSMLPADSGKPTQIFHPDNQFLSAKLAIPGDTLRISDAILTPSAESLQLNGQSTALELTGELRGHQIRMTYTFDPANYLVRVNGQVTGLGPTGGLLLLGMGPGLRNTESDSVEHRRELGVVVKADESKMHRFQSIARDEPALWSGPFEWVAVKSKYFVTAVFAVDSTQPAGSRGKLSGARGIHADPVSAKPALLNIETSLPITADGSFEYLVYAGPMEYPRLQSLGNDFDDVNPYGWPGFRTIIRPVALAARWLLVWMHDSLGFAFGLGLVTFGVLIRVLLWPLNQKAMRSSMEMQAIQPIMKELQEKYKNDPQRLQQEMFKLYKEHKVNPLGGCWPMLLPWPVLLALFFVFQNTIELRGESFLWMPDLSRADPLFITPVLMGASMFALMKLGQVGVAPNPQMKMMLYIMPPLMTFMFGQFASGLNLYYLVSNLASLPQQWLLTKERLRRNPPQQSVTQPRKAGKRQ